MGTRSLTTVRYNKEIKVAQYGQWDGYPGWQGQNIVSFLISDNVDIEKFKEYISTLSWITPEEHKERWVEMGADSESDLVSFDISKKFGKKYPELSRDTGGEILRVIYDNKGKLKLQNNIDFHLDSLFCEYAYLIDLDKMTLEIYEGFQKEPHNEPLIDNSNKEGEYYSVKRIKTFEINSDLNTSFDTWLQLYNQQEEEYPITPTPPKPSD